MDSLSIIWEILERLTGRDDIDLFKVEKDAHPVLRQFDYAGIDYVAQIGAYQYGIGWREQDWAFRTYRTFTPPDGNSNAIGFRCAGPAPGE